LVGQSVLVSKGKKGEKTKMIRVVAGEPGGSGLKRSSKTEG